MTHQTIDPGSHQPVYLQIAHHLRAAIRTGELGPGARLPSERELTEQYNVARMTVRQALDVLKGEGLVASERGRGVFVRARPPIRRRGLDRLARERRRQGQAAYLADMQQQDSSPEVRVLRVGPVSSSPEVAGRLGLAEGARVLERHRLYLADGHPVQIATSYIPWDIAEGTAMTQVDTGPGGIYARIEEQGHQLRRFTEEVTARMPLPEEVRMLRLPQGVPVLCLLRTAHAHDDRVVETCATVMVADAWTLLYEFPAR